MSSSDDDDNNNGPHILVFPYPAPGHIIPVLDFTRLLLTRGLTVTVVVTPPHLPLLDPLLSTYPYSSIQPLVLSPPDLPPTSNLPFLAAKIRALSELYTPIIQWFRSHPSPPVAVVSDMFLGWTHRLASDLGIPSIVFWSSGAFPASIFNSMWRDLPKIDDPDDEDCFLSFPGLPNSPKYPQWQITSLYREFKAGDPDWEFFRNSMLANTRCWGAVLNSFTELERVYIDHLKKEMGHDRVWAVGPLLPPDDDLIGSTKRGGSSAVPNHEVMGWLDSKPDGSVVYVCFGSRWSLSNQQVGALAAALECSGVHFIWSMMEAGGGHVVNGGGEMPDGFEDRVEGRGYIIKGWAPQVAILRHRAVGAFVTHCGWNSMLEGLAAGVLMLTWPLAADQFANAKLMVDELGVAVRFCEVGDRTVPNSDEMARLLAESVGKAAKPNERARLVELRDAARKALEVGGRSSRDMDSLVKQLREL